MTRTDSRALARLPAALAFIILFALGGCAFLRRPPPVVDRTADPRIRAELEQRLINEPSIDAQLVRVEVDGGVVQLHGSVEGIGAWRCAILNAQLISGVVTVVDYLAIDRGPQNVVCVASRDAVTPAREPVPPAPSNLRPGTLRDPDPDTAVHTQTG